MELHQLRYFLATADTRSVSRAAERCGIAQPSLSQQLRKLETDLGVQLFDRLGRGMILTDAGKTLLPRARRILADVIDARGELRQDVASGHAALSVGAIQTIGPYVLPRALRQLTAAMPDCAIAVREDLTDNLLAAVVDNEIDCAIVSSHKPSEWVVSETIAQEQMLVVVPRKHPLARQDGVTLEQLRDQPTVSLQDVHCLGQQIDGFCAAHHVTPRITCRATQLETIFGMVSLGMGISIVPEMACAIAASTAQSRGCQFLRLSRSRPTRPIVVAWRRDRTRPVAARTLVELMKKQFEEGLHRFDA